MKKTVIFIFISVSIFAMDRDKYEDVMSLIRDKSYSEAFSRLSELKNTYSDDPEYYALVINYYFSKSRSGGIIVRNGEPTQDQHLLLYDSTNAEPVGVIEEQITYNLDTLETGIREFETGLEKFPRRLDLHFGLIHTLAETEQYGRLEEKFLTLIRISIENENNWLWSFNEPYSENAGADFLGNVQDYLHQLFQKENSAADSVLIMVSKSLVENYPECIFGYNNLGAIYSISQKYSLAQEYFEKAVSIDENDLMVLANLANICTKNNQLPKAIKYYKKIASFADEESAAWAKEQIKLLKK